MAQEPDSLAFRFAVVLAFGGDRPTGHDLGGAPHPGSIRLRQFRIATRFTGLSI
jgi:hypothetical protein